MIPGTISHYRTIKMLSAGGMGEVYLAQDVRLGRLVALKLLPARFTQDQDRLRRFKLEARAASSLNHPNILTVYEIGQVDSIYYISMEFIDGETLRRRMDSDRLRMSDVVEIGTQVAAALAVAHAAGIVHRDIKPENIMLRRDGYAKVVDFGLAKLTEDLTEQGAASDAATILKLDTGPEIIMGTVNYMSPEQLRRQKLDGRADIWSLGVVLYEMIAGRPPFEGRTSHDVIASILEREPEPLLNRVSDVPVQLSGIVMKMLRKDRQERHQHTRDLLLDLKQFGRELEFGAGPGMPVERASTPGTVAITDRKEAEIVSTHEISKRPVSRIERLIVRTSCHKAAMAITLLAVVIIAALVLYLARHEGTISDPGIVEAFSSIEIARIPYTEKAIRVAISPDGKYLAYVESDGGRESIWVRQLGTQHGDQPGMLLPPADVQYYGLTFSHDGTYIYYIAVERTKVGVLYRVDILKGAAVEVVRNVDSPVTLSPDGTRLAFIRYNPNQAADVLIVANADGTEEEMLATRKRPEFFTSIVGPEWSPDGKVVACGAGSDTRGSYRGVVAVSLENGSEAEITPERWMSIGRFAWLGDASGLILPAAERGASTDKQIWCIPYPTGAPRRVTQDPSNYIGVRLTKDSKVIATVQTSKVSNFYVVSEGKNERVRKITSWTFGGYDLSLTPEGSLLYVSQSSGNMDLWVMDRDGQKERQLTFDPGSDRSPTASPDGRYIVFCSNREGSFNVWRMDSDGRNLKQLTDGSDANNPHCSPDSKWVIYSGSDRSGTTALWRVPMEGGDPERLTSIPVKTPLVSPDGKLIAFSYWEEAEKADKVGIIKFDGGELMKTFGISPSVFRWAADGGGVTYVDNRGGASNIWRQALGGGAPQKITEFKELEIYSFDWSKDGRLLVCERGASYSSAVLIKDHGNAE